MKDLINLSQYYGNQSDHVQAGGGNSSVKNENGTIMVKASGCLLSEVCADNGFVTLDFAPIVEFFTNDGEKAESKYNEMISSLISSDSARPSMESGFHAVLSGKFVLHTHSVWANLLTCSDGGLELLETLDESYVLVPYLTPGIPLSSYIANIESPPQILFLQNHGVIVHGNTAKEVRVIYDNLHKKIRKLLEIDKYPEPIISATNFPHSLGQGDLFSKQMDRVICPDQAIYFSMTGDYNIENSILSYNINDKKAYALEQMALSVSFTLAEYKRRNWGVNFIKPAKIAQLLNLDSEKYRQCKASA